MSDTLETDAEEDASHNFAELVVPSSLARRLERERDEAIELLKYSSAYSTTKSQQDTYKFLRKIGKLECRK